MSSINLYRLVTGPDGKTTTDEVFTGGWDAIYVAVSLLRLCDRERGDALYRLLVDEIEVADERGHRIMTAAHMRRVVELLEGIEDRIATVTVRGHVLTDEKAIEALALRPPIAEKNEEDDGAAGYNLSNAFLAALELRYFLQESLQMGAVVALG